MQPLMQELLWSHGMSLRWSALQNHEWMKLTSRTGSPGSPIQSVVLSAVARDRTQGPKPGVPLT